MIVDGATLVRARIHAGLTQLQLAKRCEVSTRTVMRWEKPPPHGGRYVAQHDWYSRRAVDVVLRELVGNLPAPAKPVDQVARDTGISTSRDRPARISKTVSRAKNRIPLRRRDKPVAIATSRDKRRRRRPASGARP